MPWRYARDVAILTAIAMLCMFGAALIWDQPVAVLLGLVAASPVIGLVSWQLGKLGR
jgi:hypothetical protein